MELELRVDAGAAAQIFRLPALSAAREGRPNSQAMKVIWHDSPDHALVEQGLILAEHRGRWRIERLVPGSSTWLPAQPSPVIADSDDKMSLPDLPPHVAPVAAFDGRRGRGAYKFGESIVTVVVEKGVLRAVTAERPAARIVLTGEPRAVREVATLIGQSVPVSVPVASLAAEAIALATGGPPPPRHAGSPVLPDGCDSIADALAHILGHLTDVVLANVNGANNGPEPVHQMRVAVRRARSALSVFRTALPPGRLDAVRDDLKALGGRLGPTRDWDVFAEETAVAIATAVPGDERLNRMIAAAARRRRDCQKALSDYLRSNEFRMLGVELAWFAASRSWHPTEEDAPPPTLAAFAGTVLRHRWKKLISAGKRIQDLDIAGLHGVRLRAKQVRYAAEMFSSLYPGKESARFIRRLSQLQQRLGVLNDGAVATHLLAEIGGPGGRHAYAAGIVTGYMAARTDAIKPGIMKAFERFRRIPGYWA